MSTTRFHVTAFVEPDASIHVEPVGDPGLWIINCPRLHVHFDTRADLTRLRDTITAALDAAPEEP